MSDIWEGFTRDENGELVLDIYANPPVEETDEDLEDEFDEESEDEAQHTYATIDCGGDCGGCVALIVDGDVISGPPFHPNCRCTLSAKDIENADYHASHLHQDVASNRNVDTHDVKWLKKALAKLGYYTPDIRAGESANNFNQYPNQNLFDAIDDFRKENKIKERGAVKPGHWTEVKINERLQKLQKLKKLKALTHMLKETVQETEDVKDMTTDEKFEQAYNKLKEPEGRYTDGKNQVSDEPTNMGIKQSTLDNYAKQHPEKDFPSDVKDLESSQAKEIFKEVYWDNTNIPEIKNDRIRNAVFDMNVMGGAGRVVQRALNDFSDAGLAVDGKIGPKTVDALNSIPANKVSDFMETLKAERFEYLQKTDNWPTAKNGWSKRTNKY